MPFSLDAALSGTVTSYKKPPPPPQPVEVPTLEESIPKSWMFDIHEDTAEERAGNLINHYTCTLDISSDDESRIAAKDDRGKENIPPVDGLVYTSAAVTTLRADMMTDEPRSPLGTLDAKDFYAEGCDASSYIVVPAEKDGNQDNEKVATATESNQVSSMIESTVHPDIQHADGWTEFFAQVEQSKQETKDATKCPIDIQETSHQPEIEIWESDSAKGDNDTVAQDLSRPSTPFHVLQPVTDVPEVVDDSCLATMA